VKELAHSTQSTHNNFNGDRLFDVQKSDKNLLMKMLA
jgi:hypothetical protein